MTVRYNQSGYCGSSRSIRASQAEDDGNLPLYRAIKEVSRLANVTQKFARQVLQETGPCESHHTSKYANLTEYYDCNEAIKRIIDPFWEEVEEAETCENYGYGWHDLRPCWSCKAEPIEYVVSGTREAYELGLLSPRRSFLSDIEAESRGEQIQHAANFRRWETALRRLALVA